MNFLELTSYIGGLQEYADFPYFPDDVWPLLKRKGTEIESLFLLLERRRVGWAGHYQVVTERIVRISAMNELTPEELSKIELWSFYGGHLNVLYLASVESSLMRELCNMYPVVNLSSDAVDQLALDEASLAELRAFTDRLPPDSLLFSFAHDGEPLYIFGHLETLKTLLSTSRMNSKQGSNEASG